MRSELGVPIHKVATRAVKLWKEFDDTVFKLAREKREPWLKERKSEIIGKLNKDFQKPWFGAKKDGYAVLLCTLHVYMCADDNVQLGC